MTAEPEADDEAASAVSARFHLWLTCGVALGVLPVLLSIFLPALAGKGIQLVGPLSDGELLIASSAIGGASLGELFDATIKDAEARRWRAICGGVTIVLALICAAAYATVKSTSQQDQTAGGGATVIVSSVVLFLVTVCVAGACIRVAARARESERTEERAKGAAQELDALRKLVMGAQRTAKTEPGPDSESQAN